MCVANNSLPVPVSPVSNTVAGVGATWLAWERAAPMASLFPTTSDGPCSVLTSRRR